MAGGKFLPDTSIEAKSLERKTTLLLEILRIVEKEKYTQAQVCNLLRQKQPHVSNLLNGKISQFSVEKLMEFLDHLGADTDFCFSYVGERYAARALD